MLAHIKDGQVIRTYHENKGRVTFENGSTVSPPAAGVYGDEQLVPIVEVTVDNSTNERTTSATVETVEADRVLRTVTISDVSIEDIREGQVVSSMQGILTLGETNWGRVLAYRETASWAEQMIIDSAQDWRRTSQNIQFIGYLIGFSDDQMDTMFTAAALVEA